MVMPVGAELEGSMAQLPRRVPEIVYLKTLSMEAEFTIHRELPSVTIPLAFPPASEKLVAASWLPETRAAAPTYLKTRSLFESTIQISVPLVAIPCGEAFEVS